MRTIRILFLLPLLFFAGCITSLHTPTGEGSSPVNNSSNYASVSLTTEPILAQPYKEVCQVIGIGDTKETAVKELRKQAAKYGSSNIINFRLVVQRRTVLLVVIPITVDQYFASGTGVKLTNAERTDK